LQEPCLAQNYSKRALLSVKSPFWRKIITKEAWQIACLQQ